MGQRDKRPKTKESPPPRGARQAVDPEDTNRQTPVWSIAIFDYLGTRWGRTCCETENATWVLIFPKLRAYETMTWGEIYQDKERNHSVAVTRLVKPAQDRLAELKLDDQEELFRFRLSGTERVWGIRDGRVFQLLWYDPDHEVCPSRLKNT